MKVGNGQQFRFPRFYPFFTLASLTFWTVAVTAGVVTDANSSARRTGINVTSQFRRPATAQGGEGTQLETVEPRCFYQFTKSPQDTAYFRFSVHCSNKVSSGLNARFGLLRATCRYSIVVWMRT